MNWYNYSWNYAVRKLNSDIYRGLRDEQVEQLRKENKDNKIIEPKIKSFFYFFRKSFFSLWSILSIFIEILFIVYSKNNKFLFAIFLLITLINIIILSLEEYKGEAGLKEINKLNSHQVRVLRNGKMEIIDSEKIVLGDIILVKKGEIIPADLRIIESQDLRVIESAITGEKNVIEKYEAKIQEKDIELSDMRNMLFKSSVVTEGEGIGIVVESGMNTQLGNIIEGILKREDKKEKNNLKFTKTMNLISVVILISFLIVFLINSYQNKSLYNFISIYEKIACMFLSQIWIVILNVFFFYEIKKLKKKNIYIKNYFVFNKINNISSVLFNKVGSLSENDMELRKIYLNGNTLNVDDEEFDVDDNIKKLLCVGLLCNDSKYNFITNESRGNLEDIELIKFCNFYSLKKFLLEKENVRINEIPYDSGKKIMTTINKVSENYRANVKGSVDEILERCTHILINGIEREITKDDINDIKNANLKMCGESLNVTAYATRAFNYEPSLKENLESNLVFMGMIGFYNSIKKDALENLINCTKNGINPIVIMEENKLTAFSIGKNTKTIKSIENVLSGIEIEYMSDEELENILYKANILCKIDYRQQAKVAKTLQKLGYKSAMIGSRIKDLSYLIYCNLIISCGDRCSNIIKKISDVYFDTYSIKEYVEITENSKKISAIVKNIFTFVFYSMIYECTTFLVFLLFNNKTPFTLSKILWTNFIAIPIIVLALLLEKNNINFMEFQDKYEDSSYKNKLYLETFLMSITSMIFFNIFNNKFLFSNGIWFIVFIFLLNLFSLNFKNEDNYFFSNKKSNLIIGVNVILAIITLFI